MVLGLTFELAAPCCDPPRPRPAKQKLLRQSQRRLQRRLGPTPDVRGAHGGCLGQCLGAFRLQGCAFSLKGSEFVEVRLLHASTSSRRRLAQAYSAAE